MQLNPFHGKLKSSEAILNCFVASLRKFFSLFFSWQFCTLIKWASWEDCGGVMLQEAILFGATNNTEMKTYVGQLNWFIKALLSVKQRQPLGFQMPPFVATWKSVNAMRAPVKELLCDLSFCLMPCKTHNNTLLLSLNGIRHHMQQNTQQSMQPNAKGRKFMRPKRQLRTSLLSL